MIDEIIQTAVDGFDLMTGYLISWRSAVYQSGIPEQWLMEMTLHLGGKCANIIF